MTHAIDKVLDEIARLPHDWHGAGTVEREVLEAIVRHTAGQPLTRSAETGSGKTTLLFSQLSADHTVFAVDAGGSISRVKESPLFNPAHTTFVTGPTQRTLPTHRFHGPHQLVLIDGPHGYPFPDLEYYYFYQTLERDALLIIDDLRIPTIGRMFEIVRSEAMFELVEVVGGNTAFLRRTDAPLINPEADAWWEQAYNRSYYDEIMGVRK